MIEVVAKLESELTNSYEIPCDIGDDIYFIPSFTNVHLNIVNRREVANNVYHQKAARIVISGKNDWYIELDKNIEFGIERLMLKKGYGETWFLSQEEAENKLKDYIARVKDGKRM